MAGRRSRAWVGLALALVALGGCGASQPDDSRATEAERPATARQAGIAGDAAAKMTSGEIRGTFGEGEESLGYRLYVPARPGPSPPLVVVLHGCTQDAEDAARGTRMDAWADRARFLVLYPEQRASAHPMRCWRWYEAAHQRRGSGEPALLVGMIREVARSRAVNPDRIYVVGLSAGGAMALSLVALHPELFAGVGIHSGMPFGVAADEAEAQAALAGGGPEAEPLAARLRDALQDRPLPPLAVFQGQDDVVVAPANAERIVESWLRAAAERPVRTVPPFSDVDEGTSAGGLGWTRRTWTEDAAGVHVEWWTVEGLGHAWSGGNEAGTFTDPQGPDATEAFLRFFCLLRG